MDNTLVICRNASMRKFYVDNLLIRSHLAIGIESLARQPELFSRQRFTLIIIRGA